MKKMEKLKVPADLSSSRAVNMMTLPMPALRLNKETVAIFINNYGPINGTVTQPLDNLNPPTNGRLVCGLGGPTDWRHTCGVVANPWTNTEWALCETNFPLG